MANAPFHVFANGLITLSTTENITADTVKLALIGNTNPANYTYTATTVGSLWTDISPTEASTTGTGYSAGGLALTMSNTAYSGSSSFGTLWTTSWASSTAYSVGAVVRPSTANGYIYQAVVAGTSGSSAPSFPTTIGTTVTDSGVTWLNIGTSVTVLSTSTTIQWTTTTGSLTTFYGILYDSSVGTGGFASSSTCPLLGYYDMSNGGTGFTASGGGTLTITVPSSGFLALGSS